MKVDQITSLSLVDHATLLRSKYPDPGAEPWGMCVCVCGGGGGLRGQDPLFWGTPKLRKVGKILHVCTQMPHI